MKILGTKFFGQDSAVFLLDTEKKEVFAISSDRITRIKKDNYDVSPILEHYKKSRLCNVERLSYSFNKYNGNDAVLETKGTSYYWLNYQRILRTITKPKYRSDILKKRSLIENAIVCIRMLVIPKIIKYKVIRDYYWRKYLSGTLPKNFHFEMIDRYIKETLTNYKMEPNIIEYHDHHTCHAYSAYYSSPFAYNETAIVFTLDEHGDESFSKIFKFSSDKQEELRDSKCTKFWIGNRVHVTSIADIYSNFTEAMDLIRSTDEGKVEALAAYGMVDSRLFENLNKIIQITDLTFKFDLDIYKEYSNISFLKTIREDIGDENFCATVQHWLEDVTVTYLNKVYEHYKIDNLCLAGGVTANVIMNYRIYNKTPFKNIYVVPAMGDEGSSMGAAIISAIDSGHNLRWLKKLNMPYYGPSFELIEIEKAIKYFETQIDIEYYGDKWSIKAAESIVNNNVIGVFHGRMEFGPRALGNRSILANATSSSARDKINSTIKRRPYYQPFCPTVLESEREKLFENSYSHKYMATAFLMREEYRKKLPSAIHVDGTSRPQFIEHDDNPAYFKLVEEVKRLTGFGVVINTSFNLHGRPVVHTPEDAITDFIDCNMDELYLEGYRITRKNN